MSQKPSGIIKDFLARFLPVVFILLFAAFLSVYYQANTIKKELSSKETGTVTLIKAVVEAMLSAHLSDAIFLSKLTENNFGKYINPLALREELAKEYKFFSATRSVYDQIRFIGGGAKSRVWCQIFADVLQREIQPVIHAQDGGAIGAALIAAVGLGVTTFEQGKNLIPVGEVITPNKENKALYDRIYEVFTKYYTNTKKFYRELNK